MWFLVIILGGGYLAYRHYHQGRIVNAIRPHLLTLSPGEIRSYGNKLLMMLAFQPSGYTTPEAVAFLRSFKQKLDREAIAHSAKQQGANPKSVDSTSLASDLE